MIFFLQYCLTEMNGGMRTFKVPTLDDVLKHRVVVVTLSISMYLSTIGLRKGKTTIYYKMKLFFVFSYTFLYIDILNFSSRYMWWLLILSYGTIMS